ncbi:MAG: hypothetical protein IPJ89_00135 [Candidatus Iainarchaeum archaeon]|uniref:Uncharacterized protein n=1 Tax=Candidatus Iainarchaeum sp. TaxID=3101447 RepID=A0A7T9DJS9_9ARCH|nr:MAG: hypothetical protein IPJ89_00135 [Candidatus Diapherotrites archaeon]
MMPTQRGQLFSLDMIVAAVLFTVALGLLLGQSELWISSEHQSRETSELHAVALLASNALTSKPQITASDGAIAVNLRCAPAEWAAHQDISWVENCVWFDPTKSYAMTTEGLGIPPGYGFKIGFTNPAFDIPAGLVIPAGKAFMTIDRNMLVFPSNPSAAAIATCFSAGCPGNIQTVHISVWGDA